MFKIIRAIKDRRRARAERRRAEQSAKRWALYLATGGTITTSHKRSIITR